MRLLRGAGALALAGAVALASCADEPADPADRASEPTASSTAASSSTTTASAGCGGEPPAVPENRIVSSTIESSGGERSYLVYVPPSYDPATPSPVAFTFHGAGSNKEQQMAYSAFAPMADTSGALVVAPDALGTPRRWSPYGAATSVDEAGVDGVRDLTFFVDLLDELERSYCVDPSRVWVTGMSSGGFMSAAIACEHSDLIAAAAPVTATAWTDTACAAAQPMPYVYFHGTDDPVVPFLGPIPGPGGEPGPGAAEVTAAQWAAHNGCAPDPDEERVGSEVVHRTWTGCDAPTDLYIVEGGGHTWPGGPEVPRLGHTTTDVSASEVIWELFESSQR
jgi:polyhydroxybutyrate depolymerase